MTGADDPTTLAHEVLDAVEVAIVGKRDVLSLVLAGILTRGHVLLEDLPGVAKTMLARSFAAAMGGVSRRIQFTPDLLPTDITGAAILTRRGKVEFRPGPVFANIVLGDEINRAPPKTQSALLEAMQEPQVTIDGDDARAARPSWWSRPRTRSSSRAPTRCPRHSSTASASASRSATRPATTSARWSLDGWRAARTTSPSHRSPTPPASSPSSRPSSRSTSTRP